jgi:DNA-binding transcriptional ArsR family regulator
MNSRDRTEPDRDLSVVLNQPIPELKAELFKALAHPARIRILEVLTVSEHAVGEMQPLVGIEASHLSQQLAVLRHAGLVATRRDGASVIYSLLDPQIADLLATAKQILINSLTTNEDLLADLRAAADQ